MLPQVVVTAPTVGSNTETFSYRNLKSASSDRLRPQPSSDPHPTFPQIQPVGLGRPVVATTILEPVLPENSCHHSRRGLDRPNEDRACPGRAGQDCRRRGPCRLLSSRRGQGLHLMRCLLHLQALASSLLLVFANKQDVPGCLTASAISENLGWGFHLVAQLALKQQKLTGHRLIPQPHEPQGPSVTVTSLSTLWPASDLAVQPSAPPLGEWQIIATSALTGQGLDEGLDWLATRLTQ